MYDLNSLISKIVTIQTVSGQEIVGQFLSTDETQTIITLSDPRQVVISNDEVYVIPFSLTGETAQVHFQKSALTTIMKTLESTETDYLNYLAEEQRNTTQEAEAQEVDVDQT